MQQGRRACEQRCRRACEQRCRSACVRAGRAWHSCPHMPTCRSLVMPVLRLRHMPVRRLHAMRVMRPRAVCIPCPCTPFACRAIWVCAARMPRPRAVCIPCPCTPFACRAIWVCAARMLCRMGVHCSHAAPARCLHAAPTRHLRRMPPRSLSCTKCWSRSRRRWRRAPCWALTTCTSCQGSRRKAARCLSPDGALEHMHAKRMHRHSMSREKADTQAQHVT